MDKWVSTNKLSFNITVSSTKSITDVHSGQIKKEDITQEINLKKLGITIDRNLTFDNQSCALFKYIEFKYCI